jgi:type VI protein secretion system component VasK
MRSLFQRVIAVLAVLLVLGLLALMCFAAYTLYQQNPPRIENLDDRLPRVFHFGRLWVVWAWITGLQASAVALLCWVFRLIRRLRTSSSASDSLSSIGQSPDLDETWKEIDIRSGRGFLDRVYLMLTPSEEHADALLQASGLQIECRVPREPSLIHATRAAGATFVTCVARPPQIDSNSVGAPSRVEYVCERLRAASSGPIGLRGVIVILPVDWLNRPDSARLAIAYRGDLQAIPHILELRCPVYFVITGLESEPGFLEFANRMAESFRTRRRCGFFLPGEPEDATRLVHGGLVWLSGWYQTWMLYLMAKEPLDHDGNNALYTFGSHLRAFRRRVPELLGTAFAALPGGENLSLNGCYLAATGPSPETVACAAGIIRGRVLEDTASRCWAAPALDRDRTYRQAALAVGLIGGGAALLVWAFIDLGIRSIPWLGLAMPAVLAAAWIVALLRFR